MRSNFSAARGKLEQAYEHLHGDDETSQTMRDAIGILIDAMVVKQFAKREARILPFPSAADSNDQGSEVDGRDALTQRLLVQKTPRQR